MNRWRFARLIALLTALLSCPIFASAGAHTVAAGGERLEFMPQAEKGYVIKLAEQAGGIHALAGISALDAEDARPVGGLDRRGVWTVENEGPTGRNADTIRSLRATGQVAYAAPLFSSGGETVAILPEIVVRVKPGTEIGQLKALCEKAACTIKKRMEFTEQEYLLEVLGPDAEAVFAAVDALNAVSFVEWAWPNTAFQPRLRSPAMPADHAPGGQSRIAAAGEDTSYPGVFPNDPYFPRQWHLHNTGQSGGTPGADIRATEAWEITTGDPNIVVAEFGGYVDTNHPDLVNNLVPGHDFVQPGSIPVFDNLSAGHSTWCAGIVAAQGNNGIGVTGVTWNCKIMPIRIWEDRPLPAAHKNITEAERATAIRWAATNGAHVLDCQWAYSTPQPTVRSAIADVTRPGGIGRNGKGCVAVSSGAWYPGQYHEVIAVGSTDHNDNLFSGNFLEYHGPELDIAAPDWAQLVEEKGGLWTTDVMGSLGMSSHPMHPDPNVLDYSIADGATSIVSGVAALILSIEPNLTGDEVRHFLERSAKDLGDPGRDDYYGWGRVDARAALDMVLAKRADLNNDWKVDEEDRAILLRAMETNDRSGDIAPAAKRDGKVDQKDLELLTRYLGTVIPEMGLIAHWKLDETAGAIAHDSAGEHRDATVMGTPLWRADGGKVGGALELSGAPNFATAKFARDPSQGPFSVFAWVKGGAPGQVILSQAGGVNWLMAGVGTGALATELKESGRSGKPLTSAAILADGNWHRVGVVWDGSNRILYADGVEAARDTQAALASSTGNLTIGAGSTMAPASFWKGLIDDVRIYDRVVKP